MRVYIEGLNPRYEEMYESWGYEVVERVQDAEFVQFIGGPDLDPRLYGEDPHPNTFFDVQRDAASKVLYDLAKEMALPCVGICRGAQYLNVRNGGRLFQHVDGHTLGDDHCMVEVKTQFPVAVTSTHHQMMIPSSEGEIIATAREATIKESMYLGNVVRYMGDDPDVEVVWYPNSKDLCYQPHPEILSPVHPCQKYFFLLVQEHIGA